MLQLPDVTLCCVDAANHALALRALERSRTGIAFARALLLTHDFPLDIAVPAGIDVVDIGPLASRNAYSQFVLKALLPHIATSHVLLVQWDGFVINPAAWDPAFLACDYLGAQWFWHTDGMRVGNGGFSLRSRRLLQALEDPRIVLDEVEDVTICRTFRPLLESEHGIRFGSKALADRFAFEAAYPIGTPFGFHGLFNFCRTVPPADIAAMAPQLSDAIACSAQLGQLLRNCAALGQWVAVRALAQRILQSCPDEHEARELLRQVEGAISSPHAIGRNEPCHCGSGRKYKQCHGALVSGSSTAAHPSSAVGVSSVVPPVDAVLKAALEMHRKGDLEVAETGYQQVLYWCADHPLAMHYLGVLYFQRNRLDEAFALLSRTVVLVPQEPEFHNNLGLALTAMDRGAEAIDAYHHALALKPDHAVAWNNLGLALTAGNRLAEAIAAYRRAIAILPTFGHAHWNLALALLATREYAEGWREYEYRLALAELGGSAPPVALPRWSGTLQEGHTIVLCAEQGLGDTIQFTRFAKPLADAGMRVILQVPQAMTTLLASAPGVAVAVTPGHVPAGADYAIPLLSVAGALGVTEATLRTDVPYLHPEMPRRIAVRTRLGANPSALKAGLGWAGAPGHANDMRRSLPFATLRPLLDAPGITWYSLQKDVTAGAPLIELDARNNLDDIAALIAELDLVVSVDTGIAHLAGALGRPTWILLPYAPDWRWQLERADSPWYPTMRLFRQPRPGDWASVLDAVIDALQKRLAPARVR